MHQRAVRLYMLSAPPVSYISYAENLVIRGVIRRCDKGEAQPSGRPWLIKVGGVVKREPNRWVSGTWNAEGPEQSTPHFVPI